jgi:hypothetical protein
LGCNLHMQNRHWVQEFEIMLIFLRINHVDEANWRMYDIQQDYYLREQVMVVVVYLQWYLAEMEEYDRIGVLK